jgi:hypothetical protein
MPPTKRKPRTAVKRATGPKVPVTHRDQGYTPVPVTDVWLSDDEIQKVAVQQFDWIGIGDKAVEGAKTRPDEWLLVADSASPATAGNITSERIRTLTGPRFIGWKFRGKVTDMVKDPNTGRWAKGRIWIKASRSTVDV